jgi:hypothetical protein
MGAAERRAVRTTITTSIVLGLITTSAYAQEAQTEDVKIEVDRWDMAFAAGVSNVTYALPGMQLGGTMARTTMPTSGESATLEPTTLFSLRLRMGERVLWSVPTLSFAYLGGVAREREWIPWGGLTGWSVGYSSIEKLIVDGDIGAGIGVREWASPATAINVTAAAASAFHYRGNAFCGAGEDMCPSWRGPRTWVTSATAGVSQQLGDSVSLNLGAGVSRELSGDGATSVSFGSVQAIGLRQLPLLQAHLNRRWSIDGYAMASYDVTHDRYEQRYLLGFTRVWPQ